MQSRRTVRKTTKGRLAPTRGPEDTRLFMHLILTFLHRAHVDMRAVYFGDLELASVAGTIGLASLDPYMMDPDFRDLVSDIRTVVGVERQRPINALSIAQATGIPRETVRRKLKILVARGVLLEQGRGRYVFKPGFVQQPHVVAIAQQAITNLLKLMNSCVTQGLVHWEDVAGEKA